MDLVNKYAERHPAFPSATKLHQGRRYLVTGGARGIGRATAEVLLAHGAVVAIADVNPEAVVDTAKTIGALPIQLDVTSRQAWEDARSIVSTEFGGRLDGLVNNAGVARDKILLKMDDLMWDTVLDTHLRGSWLGCQIFHPLLCPAENEVDGYGRPAGGAIVNTSSSGRHGAFGQSNYASAKAGILGLTKTVALEYARYGIRANAVSPGPIVTEMTSGVPEEVKKQWLKTLPLSRMGQPHEIGEVVAFLLSGAASYITGQVIDVNGGESHP